MTQTVSVFVDRPYSQVYEFLVLPENFSHWASGLGESMKRVDGEWVVQSPEGIAQVRFTEHNALGVLDHIVYLPDGSEVYVPMRAIAYRGGCEVLLTLFRQRGMTDAKFAADLEWVKSDLAKLKSVLEAQ